MSEKSLNSIIKIIEKKIGSRSADKWLHPSVLEWMLTEEVNKLIKSKTKNERKIQLCEIITISLIMIYQMESIKNE